MPIRDNRPVNLVTLQHCSPNRAHCHPLLMTVPMETQCFTSAYSYSSNFPSNELSCAIITSSSDASTIRHSATSDWTSNSAADQFSVEDNTSCSSVFESNSNGGAICCDNEHFNFGTINTYQQLPNTGSERKEKKRRSSKSSYKHVPHREKPVHLVARRNARERKRVQAVNSAFVRLRKCVPVENRNKRLSKVKTLHRAIEYINALQKLLNEDDELSTVESVTCDNDIGQEHALARTVMDHSGSSYAGHNFTATEGPFYRDGHLMVSLYAPSTLMTSCSETSCTSSSSKQNFTFKGSTF